MRKIALILAFTFATSAAYAQSSVNNPINAIGMVRVLVVMFISSEQTCNEFE